MDENNFSESIILYRLEQCPFCKKVENKLDELDLDYIKIEVPKSHIDREKPSKYNRDVPTVKDVSGQTGVPVIVDEDHGIEGMPESEDIIEYLEDTYSDTNE